MLDSPCSVNIAMNHPVGKERHREDVPDSWGSRTGLLKQNPLLLQASCLLRPFRTLNCFIILPLKDSGNSPSIGMLGLAVHFLVTLLLHRCFCVFLVVRTICDIFTVLAVL